ncbi:MAG: 2,4'-dihydroxyacetophenone dioxygenase family protein [Pseudomonadota bacterium]
MTEALAIPTSGVAETLHIGYEDLPWIAASEGEQTQLLHVDLSQGLWVVRTRFDAGVTLAKHYHTGPVFAVTQSGRWWYRETPEQVNTAGSYLFEPAMSVHTLTADGEGGEPTDVWFAIYGANVNLDDDGNVASILDAATALTLYREACAAEGLSCEKLIVLGENLLQAHR